MNCKQAEKLLVEFLYQELSAKKTVAVEKHLQVCDNCTRTLENWQAIHRGYRKSATETEAPPYLKQRILVAAREELTRKPSVWEQFNTFLKPAIVFPVIVFLLLALFVTRHEEQKSARISMAQKEPQAARPESTFGSREVANLRDQDEELKRASKTKSISDEKGRGQVGGKLDSRSDMPTDKVEPSDDRTKRADEGSSQVAEPSSRVAKNSEFNREYLEETVKKEGNAKAPETPAAAAPPSIEMQEEAAPKTVAKSNEAETFQQAQYWFKNNQLNQGKIVADQAISKDKSKSLAYQFHQAGITYQQNKEPQQAIVQFNLVLNNYPDYPNSPDVLVRLGESYEQIGQYENAIKVFQQLSQFAGMKEFATQKLSDVQNKLKAQQQLRSLGYANPN